MATVNDLIGKVRRRLRDVETTTRKGQFYTDNQIIVALNAAQLLLVYNALRLRARHILKHLTAQATILANNTSNYPTDCCAPFGGYVTQSGRNLKANLYVGREAIRFKGTRNNAIYVIGNDVSCTDASGNPTNGTLLYWKYPQQLSIGSSIATSFPEDVLDVVCLYTPVLLGIKDTIHPLDVLQWQKVIQQVSIDGALA